MKMEKERAPQFPFERSLVFLSIAFSADLDVRRPSGL